MDKKLTLNFIKLQPFLSVSFYMEYQKVNIIISNQKIINEFKYNDYFGKIYGFYELNSLTPFLRFEDYSFDLNNCHIKSGREFYMTGLLYHHSLIDNFNTLDIEKISYLYLILDKIIRDSEQNYSFVLVIFGDLKDYKFHIQYNF